MGLIRTVTTSLRQPEYTGEHRCLPCTIVNVGLAAALAVGVSLVATGGLGVGVFLAALAVIYLRGYLVPGTPRLTEQYLPASVLGLFGKAPVGDRSLEAPTADDPWETLVAAGVVDRNDDEIALTAAFRETLQRAANRRSEPPDADDVAALVGANTVESKGPQSFSIDGNQLLRWESAAALVADVAAVSVLRERLDWDVLDGDDRLELLRRIRLLLERCPACGGAVERNDERLDPCCQPPHVSVWTTCRECGDPLGDVTVPEESVETLALLMSDETAATVSD
ncbi:hypothetical protein RBH26_14870 [Natronolimnohabitans sp. A-GB9]|uniref:hypothetical protein n=1 Tax=Natronolimnohabitans sp. A-GB9 TaxID=3069757 RepID=UPI0027AFACFA|nr:hypothetical protein [Natronolimnohabitans sp. A-GB9]MDQ2051758.1 hypothetical protein [Natronolimnohabitans sp. A-GB9]